MEDQNKFKLTNVFFYLFSAVAFCFVLMFFKEIRTDLLLFKKLDVAWFTLALGAQVGTYVFNTLVYFLLLDMYSLARRFTIPVLLKVNIVQLLFNQTIPSAGLSGNAFYFSFLNKRGVKKYQAYSLILVELLSFYMSMLCILVLLFVLFVALLRPPVYTYLILYWGVAMYVFLLVIIGMLGKEGIIKKIITFLNRFSFLAKLKEKLARQMHSTQEDFVHFENPWRTSFLYPAHVSGAVVFQGAVLLLDALTIYALFGGLHVDVSFLMVLMSFIMTKVIAALPISPGDLLVFESTMTALFVSTGIPFGAAAIVTLLYRILSFWLPIPIGVIFYRNLFKSKVNQSAILLT